MAGMFYSLKEAAAKLSMTEQEVKELAKQGKLRASFPQGGQKSNTKL